MTGDRGRFGVAAPSVFDREASIQARLPAQRGSLEILRSIVGRAARQSGFSYDGIEDFAMAVDEAARILIESHPVELALTIRGLPPEPVLDRGLGSVLPVLDVVVASQDPTKTLSLAELRAGYRWDVLQALCEKVRWEEPGIAIGLIQPAR